MRVEVFRQSRRPEYRCIQTSAKCRAVPRSGFVQPFHRADSEDTRVAPRVSFPQQVTMDTSLVLRDPEIMSGALCFTGTRVPVKNLFDYLEGSSSLEVFLEDFPSVSRVRAIAVLEAARERLAADAPAA